MKDRCFHGARSHSRFSTPSPISLSLQGSPRTNLGFPINLFPHLSQMQTFYPLGFLPFPERLLPINNIPNSTGPSVAFRPLLLLSSSLHLMSLSSPHRKSRYTHSFQCLFQAAEATLLLVLAGDGCHLLSLLLVPWFLRLHSRGWNLLLILPLQDSLKAPLVKGACRLDWSWGDDRQTKGHEGP